jgi:hypothetical protein
MTNQLLRLSNPFSKRKDFWEELTEEQKQEWRIEDFKNSNTTSWDDFIVNYL